MPSPIRPPKITPTPQPRVLISTPMGTGRQAQAARQELNQTAEVVSQRMAERDQQQAIADRQAEAERQRRRQERLQMEAEAQRNAIESAVDIAAKRTGLPTVKAPDGSRMILTPTKEEVEAEAAEKLRVARSDREKAEKASAEAVEQQRAQQLKDAEWQREDKKRKVEAAEGEYQAKVAKLLADRKIYEGQDKTPELYAKGADLDELKAIRQRKEAAELEFKGADESLHQMGNRNAPPSVGELTARKDELFNQVKAYETEVETLNREQSEWEAGYRARLDAIDQAYYEAKAAGSNKIKAQRLNTERTVAMKAAEADFILRQREFTEKSARLTATKESLDRRAKLAGITVPGASVPYRDGMAPEKEDAPKKSSEPAASATLGAPGITPGEVKDSGVPFSPKGSKGEARGDVPFASGLAPQDEVAEEAKPQPIEEKGWFAQLKRVPVIGDMARGAEVSTRQIPQLGYGVAGLIGDTLENTIGKGAALRDWGFRGYLDAEQKMEPIKKDTDDVTVAWKKMQGGDIGAMGDFLEYAFGYGIGQIVETVAVAAAGGAIGAAAGSAATPAGTVAGGAGGAVAGAIAKGQVKMGVRKLMGEAIQKQAENMARQRLGKAAAAAEVKDLAASQAMRTQAARALGTNTAVFANALGMEAGSIYGEAAKKAQEEGRQLTGVDLARIMGTSVAAAGLEYVGDKIGLNLLGGKYPGKTRLGGAVAGASRGVAVESGTEAGQTILERIGAGKDAFDAEGINEIINAAAMASVMGGSMGGIGGALTTPTDGVEGQAPDKQPIVIDDQVLRASDEMRELTARDVLAPKVGASPSELHAAEQTFGDPRAASLESIKIAVANVQDPQRFTEAIADGVNATQERARVIVAANREVDPTPEVRAIEALEQQAVQSGLPMEQFMAQPEIAAQFQAIRVTQDKKRVAKALGKVLAGRPDLLTANDQAALTNREAMVGEPLVRDVDGIPIVTDSGKALLEAMNMPAVNAIGTMPEAEAATWARNKVAARAQAAQQAQAQQPISGVGTPGTQGKGQQGSAVSPSGEAAVPPAPAGVSYTYEATAADGRTVRIESPGQLVNDEVMATFAAQGDTIRPNTIREIQSAPVSGDSAQDSPKADASDAKQFVAASAPGSSRFLDLFAGVEFIPDAEAGSAPMEYDTKRGVLRVNRARVEQFVSQQGRPDYVEQTVFHELVHHAMMQAVEAGRFKASDIEGIWNQLGKTKSGRALQERVRQSYFPTPELLSEAKAAGMDKPFNMASELIRMMVESREFSQRVSEDVARDPGAAGILRKALNELKRFLEKALSKLDGQDRAELERLIEGTRAALKELQDGDVNRTETGQQTPEQTQRNPRRFTRPASDSILAFANNPLIFRIREELGGIKSRTQMEREYGKRGRSEYNDAPELPPAHNIIYRPQGMTPDNMATSLGLTVPEMWQKIGEASKASISINRAAQRQGGLDKANEAMTQRFYDATADGARPISGEDLAIGDVVEIEGTKMRVINVDEYGMVTLQDGTTFGIQQILDEEIIYVENVEQRPRNTEFLTDQDGGTRAENAQEIKGDTKGTQTGQEPDAMGTSTAPEQAFVAPKANPVTPSDTMPDTTLQAPGAAPLRRFQVDQERDPFAYAFLNRRRGRINTQEVRNRAELDAYAEAEFARRSANRFQVEPESIRRLDPVIRKAAETQVKYGLEIGRRTLGLLDGSELTVDFQYSDEFRQWLAGARTKQVMLFPINAKEWNEWINWADPTGKEILRREFKRWQEHTAPGWAIWVEENVNRPRREAAESWANELETITDPYACNLAWDIIEHSIGSRDNYGLGRPRELDPEVLEATMEAIRTGTTGDPLEIYDEERAKKATRGLRTIKAGEGYRWVFVPGEQGGERPAAINIDPELERWIRNTWDAYPGRLPSTLTQWESVIAGISRQLSEAKLTGFGVSRAVDLLKKAVQAARVTEEFEASRRYSADSIKALMALSPDSWCTRGEGQARHYLATHDYWLLLPPTGNETLGGIRLYTGTNRMEGINGVNNAGDARQLLGDHAKRIALLVNQEGIEVTDASVSKAIESVPSTRLQASGAEPAISPEESDRIRSEAFGPGNTARMVRDRELDRLASSRGIAPESVTRIKALFDRWFASSRNASSVRLQIRSILDKGGDNAEALSAAIEVHQSLFRVIYGDGPVVGLRFRNPAPGTEVQGGVKPRKIFGQMWVAPFADARSPLGRSTGTRFFSNEKPIEVVSGILEANQIAAVGAIDPDVSHRPYGELLVLGTEAIVSAGTVVPADADLESAIEPLVQKMRAAIPRLSRSADGDQTASRTSTNLASKRKALDDSLPDVDDEGNSNILYASGATPEQRTALGKLQDLARYLPDSDQDAMLDIMNLVMAADPDMVKKATDLFAPMAAVDLYRAMRMSKNTPNITVEVRGLPESGSGLFSMDDIRGLARDLTAEGQRDPYGPFAPAHQGDTLAKRILGPVQRAVRQGTLQASGAEPLDNRKTSSLRSGMAPQDGAAQDSRNPQGGLTDADRAYLDAVERGDLEAAQRMVDEAARAAGFKRKVWRGDKKLITEFDRDFLSSNFTSAIGFSFTTDRVTAENYGTARQYYLDTRKTMRFDYIEDRGVGADAFGYDEEELAGMLGLDKIDTSSEEAVDAWWDKWKANVIRIDNIDDSGIANTGVYNGDIERKATLYIVRSPNLIKSAESILRDESGRVIPLSERFPELPASGQGGALQSSGQEPGRKMTRTERERERRINNTVRDVVGIVTGQPVPEPPRERTRRPVGGKIGQKLAELRDAMNPVAPPEAPVFPAIRHSEIPEMGALIGYAHRDAVEGWRPIYGRSLTVLGDLGETQTLVPMFVGRVPDNTVAVVVMIEGPEGTLAESTINPQGNTWAVAVGNADLAQAREMVVVAAVRGSREMRQSSLPLAGLFDSPANLNESDLLESGDVIGTAVEPKTDRIYREAGDTDPVILRAYAGEVEPLSAADYARHADLEAKHDAGTITDDEREEAKGIVARAARAAGFTSKGYHATYNQFDSFELGRKSRDSEPGIVWFTDNQEGAERFLERYRSRKSSSKTPRVIEAWLKPGATFDQEGLTEQDFAWLLQQSPFDHVDRYMAEKWAKEPHGVMLKRVVRDFTKGKTPYQSFRFRFALGEGFNFGADPAGFEIGMTDARDIKSAEPFTGVPLSERFNPESDSILRASGAEPKKSDVFLGWEKSSDGFAEENLIRGYRGTGARLDAPTEGVGLYVAKDRGLADGFAQGGELVEVDFVPPIQPLIAPIEDGLPILQELDVIEDPISATDSDWMRLNKQAYQNVGQWDPSALGVELTRLAESEGFDAIVVNHGANNSWAVLFRPDTDRYGVVHPYNAKHDPFLQASGAEPLSAAEYARHAELEAKHEAGTITEEERAEAEGIVEKAARAAGFNSPKVYHGSGARFDAFSRMFAGSTTEAKSAAEAFFFTTSPRTAKAYAVYTAEEGPIKALMRQAEQAEKRGDWDEYERLIALAEDSVYGENGAAATRARRENATVYQLFLRGRFREMDAEGETPSGLANANQFEEFDGSITAALKKARQLGYTGLLIRNLDDAPGLLDVSDHYAVFNPNQIKSAEPFTGVPLAQRFDSGSDSILRSSGAHPGSQVGTPNVQRPAFLGMGGLGIERQINRGMAAVIDWVGNAVGSPERRAALARFAEGALDILEKIPNLGPVARQIIENTPSQLIAHWGVAHEAIMAQREANIGSAWAQQRGKEYLNLFSKGGTSDVLGLHLPKEFAKNKDVQRRIFDYLVGEAPITALPEAVRPVAEAARRTIDVLSDRAVEAGILHPDTVARNKGTYLRRFYLKHEKNRYGLSGVIGAAMEKHRDKKMIKGKMGLEYTKARLSDAYAVIIPGANPVPVPHSADGKWRFDSAAERDAWYETFLDEQVAKEARKWTGATPLDLANARMRIAQRYEKNNPKTEEELTEMGLIRDPGYVVGKIIATMGHDIAMARMFQSFAANPNLVKDEETIGFVQMPKNRALGAISGKFVEENLARDLYEVASAGHEAVKIYDAMLALWKEGKTSWNPATHGRNMMGNLMFADFAGISPLSLKNAQYYRDAWKIVANRKTVGGVSFAELYDYGVLGADIGSQEFAAAIQSMELPEQSGNVVGDMLMALRGKVNGAYQLEDAIFKAAAYLKAKNEGGMTPKAAAEYVRQWFPYYDQVAQSLTTRTLKRSIMPFFSFYAESLRILVNALRYRTATTLKWTILPGLISQLSMALMGYGDDDEEDRKAREALTAEMRGRQQLGPITLQFSMLLPPQVSGGKPTQVDLTNINPYANSIGMRVEEGREPEPALVRLGRSWLSSPVSSTALNLLANYDPFTGKRLWHSEMSGPEYAGEVIKLLWNTWAPAPLTQSGALTRTAEMATGGGDVQRSTMERRTATGDVVRSWTGLDIRNAAPQVWRIKQRWAEKNGYRMGADPTKDTDRVGRARQRVYQEILNNDPAGVVRELNNLEKIGVLPDGRKPNAILTAREFVGLIDDRDPLDLTGEKGEKSETRMARFLSEISEPERQSVERLRQEWTQMKMRAVTEIWPAVQMARNPQP